MSHARQTGCELVVFFLRDGIEFVMIASGTVCRQSKKSLHVTDQIFDFILHHRHLHFVIGRQSCVVGSGDQKSGCCRCFFKIIRTQYVARQLHADKFVVGQILIECVDDPVAIGIGVVARLVVFKTIALSEAHDVQPMSSPAFSIVRRCKHPINQIFVGMIGQIVEKRGDFVRGWRKSQQIKRQATNQSAFVGFRGCNQSRFCAFRINKRINGIFRPAGTYFRWR